MKCQLVTHEEHGRRRIYDHVKYHSQLTRFVKVKRVAIYPHPVGPDFHWHVQGEGLCHCYDCTAEVAILKHYLSLYGVGAGRDTPDQIAKMSYETSRKLSNCGRTLRNLEVRQPPRRRPRVEELLSDSFSQKKDEKGDEG